MQITFACMFEKKLVSDSISTEEIKKLAAAQFGVMVKAVVDIAENKMVVGGELHADAEQVLLENNSEQQNLWGINIYPDMEGEDFIEFDSLINIRPRQKNFSRGVEDEKTRAQIKTVVMKLISQ